MARGYRRLSAAVEDEICARLRAGHAARPTARALGISTSGGHGYLVAVWRDPARTSAAITGSVEPGRAGGDLEGFGRGPLAAGDRRGSGTCTFDEQP